MTETATGRSDSGFMVILVASVLGLLLVPLLARAIKREAAPRPAVGAAAGAHS